MARPTTQDEATAPLPAGTRIAIVASTYHAEIVNGMVESARLKLRAAGLEDDNLLQVQAPGAYELPLIAQTLLDSGELSAVLCFGLVLKGETDHDRYISTSVSDALMRIGLEHGQPVMFGLLTCNTLEQAKRRADAEQLDKGGEVARACVQMLNLLGDLQSGHEEIEEEL
jgi:6,7-dimethyl-8-ribityllumazine synthase